MVPLAFACRVLVCFVYRVIIFWKQNCERDNAVSEGCSGKFHNIIWKEMVMEYFLRNVAGRQCKPFLSLCNSSVIESIKVALWPQINKLTKIKLMSINGTIKSFDKNKILRFKFCISNKMVDHNNMILSKINIILRSLSKRWKLFGK